MDFLKTSWIRARNNEYSKIVLYCNKLKYRALYKAWTAKEKNMFGIGQVSSKYTVSRKGALDEKSQTAYYIYIYKPK